MKFRSLSLHVISFLVILLSATSCKDDWNDHYYSEAVGKSNLNLYSYIANHPELNLSKFAELLRIAGYDSVLSKSQALTVWAPNDSALTVLPVDRADSDMVRKFVANHITEFLHSTSGVVNDTLTMRNNKLILFSKSNNSSFTLGGKMLQKSDIVTSNGILHVLKDYIPYKANLWEYLSYTKKQSTGLDSLNSYLSGLNLKTLDKSKSYSNGVFIDSVFTYSNKALNRLGALNTEDSLYTMVMPNNQAWVDAYNRIKPYYITTSADGGTSAQDYNTRWTIVQDLVYRQSTPITQDSVYSSTGNQLSNMLTVVNGVQPVSLSNGFGYTVSQLNIKPTDSWYKEIRVEAETDTLRNPNVPTATTTITAIQKLSGLNTGFSISNGYYINAVANTSGTPTLEFKIPNTLSAKYNIYCVFVPNTIIETKSKPSKVKFNLLYSDVNGNIITKGIAADNTPTTALAAATFTTTPLVMTKMLVAKNFTFPCSNIVNVKDLKMAKKTSVTLRLLSAVSSSTDPTYNRNMLVDCIILEPVP
jgi:Secreted and surface protein containing fasciclin-like repeats